MKFVEGQFYHVYNRGNNQQQVFFRDSNYRFFLKKLSSGIKLHCDILSYCLMPNHFHIEIYVKIGVDPGKLNHAIGVLLRSYTRAIQNQEGFKGSLFQQKTKAKKLDADHRKDTVNQLAICMHYIHQNPYKAGLVSKIDNWTYSSFQEYLKPQPNQICNTRMGFDVTGIIQEEFPEESYSTLPPEYSLNFNEEF